MIRNGEYRRRSQNVIHSSSFSSSHLCEHLFSASVVLCAFKFAFNVCFKLVTPYLLELQTSSPFDHSSIMIHVPAVVPTKVR